MKTRRIFRQQQAPTGNERFGASGAVARPKCSADFQVLCLVSSAVEAPPERQAAGRYRQPADSATADKNDS